MKIIIVAILTLAVLANGYRLDNQPLTPLVFNMFRAMCEHNGANYTGVEFTPVNYVQCVEVDFGVKLLETEIEDAYMYNSYDAFNKVFKKYCRKTPELKACYQKLMDAVAPCLERDKEDFITVSNNVNDQILDYLCENDGNIITTFIMGGGPQCLQEKTYEIMMCAEISNSILYLNKALSVTESYDLYDTLLHCILDSVEYCHSRIPSRMVKRVTQIIQQSIFQGTINSTASPSVPTEWVTGESTTASTTERGESTDGSQHNIQY